MPEKVIKAKNVVSFNNGEVKEQTPKATPIDVAVAEAEAAVEAANAPAPEAIETKPLTLRNSRYLDEEPQDPDWADEEDFEYETDEEGENISTFAEVFIPLHDDSTATVIRKGMVIVSVIVILCCLVAIFMKTGSIGGILAPDLTSLREQTAAVLSPVLSTL